MSLGQSLKARNCRKIFPQNMGLEKKAKAPKKLCQIEGFEGGHPVDGAGRPPNPGSARYWPTGNPPPVCAAIESGRNRRCLHPLRLPSA